MHQVHQHLKVPQLKEPQHKEDLLLLKKLQLKRPQLKKPQHKEDLLLLKKPQLQEEVHLLQKDPPQQDPPQKDLQKDLHSQGLINLSVCYKILKMMEMGTATLL